MKWYIITILFAIILSIYFAISITDVSLDDSSPINHGINPFIPISDNSLSDVDVDVDSSSNIKLPLTPSDNNISVTGTVRTWHNAEIIPNAHIAITPLYPTEDSNEIIGSSNLSGDFLIDLPQMPSDNIIGFNINVSANNFSYYTNYIPFTKSSNRINLGVIYLHSDIFYSIKILDDTGKPLKGAVTDFYIKRSCRVQINKHSNSNGIIFLSNKEIQQIFGFFEKDELRICATYKNMIPSLHCIRFNSNGNPIVPSEIVLISSYKYTGLIIDKETKIGIPNVDITITPLDGWSSLLQLFHVKSNVIGSFFVPPFCYSEGVQFSVSITANGYIPYYFESGKYSKYGGYILFKGFRDPITLDKAKSIIKITVLNENTELPIANLILSNGKAWFQSDENGILNYPLNNNDNINYLNTTFHAFGYHSNNLSKLESNVNNINEWTLRLKEANLFKFIVHDYYGNSVPSARAVICHNSIKIKEIITNDMGEAIFSLDNLTYLDVHVSIVHPNYNYYIGKPFKLKTHGNPYKFTLKERSSIIQHIKVTDEYGKPIPNKRVVSKLIIDDDFEYNSNHRDWSFSITDNYGYCDIILPYFKEGYLVVEEKINNIFIERLETKTPIKHKDVVENKKITITLPTNLYDYQLTSGIIYNESGILLKRIKLFFEPAQYQRIGRDNHATKTLSSYTEKDGSFKIDLCKQNDYWIRIPTQECIMPNGEKHLIEKRDDLFIRAGDFITITLKSWKNMIVVKITGCENPVNHEFWLESDDGAQITNDKYCVIYSGTRINDIPQSYINYYGVPQGKMKAVMKLRSGKRYDSDYFIVSKDPIVHATLNIK